MSRPASARSLSPRPVASICVYYGAGQEDALSPQDVLVVQPTLYGRAGVERLRAGGARVLGYLSVGEEDLSLAGAADGASYHLAPNPFFQSVTVDVRDPRWRAQVQAGAARLVRELGCDGLLLDTLESGDPDATLELVAALRGALPQSFLLANRGGALLPRLAPLIDGVLIEAFSTTWQGGYRPHDAQGLAYTAALLSQVRALGLTALALDYAPPDDLRGPLAQFARQRARQYGVPLCVSSRELNVVCPDLGRYNGEPEEGR